MDYLVIEKKTARQYVLIQNDGRAHYKSPWLDETFKNTLMQGLPFGDRRWDRPSSSWVVSLTHVDYLCALVRRTFGPTFLLDRRGTVVEGFECVKCGKTTNDDFIVNQHERFCGPMLPRVERASLAQEG